MFGPYSGDNLPGCQGLHGRLRNPVNVFPSDYYGSQYHSSIPQAEQQSPLSARHMPYLPSWRWHTFHNHLNWPTGEWQRYPDIDNFSPSDYHTLGGNDSFLRFPVDNSWDRGICGIYNPFGECVNFVLGGSAQHPLHGFSQLFMNHEHPVPATVEELDQDQNIQDHKSDQDETSSVSTARNDEPSTHATAQEWSASSPSKHESKPAGQNAMSDSPTCTKGCCCCCSHQHGPQLTSHAKSGYPKTEDSNIKGPRHADMDTIRELSRELKEEATNVKHERRSFQRLNQELKTILKKLESGLPHATEQPPPSDHFNGSRSRPHDNANVPPQLTRNHNHSDVNVRMYSLHAVDAAFQQYDIAWRSIFSFRENAERVVENLAAGHARAIPWPSPDLRISSLSKVIIWFSDDPPSRDRTHHHLPLEITENSFNLQKWNAFCFFVYAFDMDPYYGDGSSLDFRIDARRTRTGFVVPHLIAAERLMMLRAQLLQERLKWHPDNLRLGINRGHEIFDGRGDDRISSAVKAVWGAITQALNACETVLEQWGEM